MKKYWETIKGLNPFVKLLIVIFILFGLSFLWEPLIYLEMAVVVVGFLYFVYSATIKKQIEKE